MGNPVNERPTTPLSREFLEQLEDACVEENTDLRKISAEYWASLPDEAKKRIETLWIETSVNLFKSFVSDSESSLGKQKKFHDVFVVCSIIGPYVRMNLSNRKKG